MPYPYPKVYNEDIDSLALKAITVHKNDKSNGVFAKMRRRFGKQASHDAIRKAYKVAKLLEMETVPSNYFWKQEPMKGTVTGRMVSPSTLPMQNICGRKANLVIIDDPFVKDLP